MCTLAISCPAERVGFAFLPHSGIKGGGIVYLAEGSHVIEMLTFSQLPAYRASHGYENSSVFYPTSHLLSGLQLWAMAANVPASHFYWCRKQTSQRNIWEVVCDSNSYHTSYCSNLHRTKTSQWCGTWCIKMFFLLNSVTFNG